MSRERDASLEDFQLVGIKELLDGDKRPVCIIDRKKELLQEPIYANASFLRLRASTGNAFNSKTNGFHEQLPNDQYTEFLRWIIGSKTDDDVASYGGHRWTVQTLRERWGVVSGYPTLEGSSGTTEIRPAPVEAQTTVVDKTRELSTLANPLTNILAPNESLQPRSLDVNLGGGQGQSEEHGKPLELFDPNFSNAQARMTAHKKLVLEFDWASTDLGPISSWSLELQRSCDFLLSDPRPAALYWAESRAMMYNEAYSHIAGKKHPHMMGQPFNVFWSELGEEFFKYMDDVYTNGVAVTQEASLYYLNRNGYKEETYFSLSLIPFATGDGRVACYNSAYDVTRQVIADRRITFLLRLSQFIASSKEPKDFWSQLLKALECNTFEIPFALLYSAGCESNETLSECSEQSSNIELWSLEGTVRVPSNSSNVPVRFDSECPVENFIKHFPKHLKSSDPTLLQVSDGTLSTGLLEDLRSNGAEICDFAIFCPIRSTGENVLGFLIVGLDSHRPYDADYQLFTQLMTRQLTNSMATAVLFEEENRKARAAAELATLDRNRLTKQLAATTQEAVAADHRFRRMADLAPVGMFHIDPQGILLYANEEYFVMTQHPRDPKPQAMSWYNVIAEIDHPRMDIEWAKLLGGEPVSFELRLKSQFVPPEPANDDTFLHTWIIAAAYPDKDESGNVVGILGCLTDISRQKWAEGIQARKRLEALELKRQQESFIDMTSHEMRNPLSAIIQSADSISNSLSALIKSPNSMIEISRETLENHIDAAQTIVHCGQHQKRIIDDILILSKINSHLISVTPVEVQPLLVIKNALKMFEGELQSNDMELKLEVEESFSELSINWLKLDPSRLLQVLINLTTNAIKFTIPEAERNITIRVGASQTLPTSSNGVEFLAREPSRKDLSSGSDWGSGEIVYLKVQVQDTGRGLNEHERKLLFQRFSQASPRTHVQYGGSGLGLFISRELTELQGGQIGLLSEAGVGSTFAFYVRARRCSPPQCVIPLVEIDPQAQLNAATSSVSTGPQAEPPRAQRSQAKPDKVTVVRHVLIVEDNLVNQKVLSKQLRTAGCTVYVANHGQEALDFLQASEYWKDSTEGKVLPNFICLMDLEMPVMGGLACVRRIRELQNEGTIIGHIPVIAVTANARSEQIAVAREAGMDSVVTKPFRIPELIPEMDKLLRQP
ncbi:putative histidine kinase M3YPp [Coleophoma cylindrospora]|uniref:Putative histidine kinase M3YPp n=1 Tax=Coleophoma cylindrospora TaxID=1849047 RepID=A0A3D8S847_9HELO|nr:putative histidine kinase M3YPp [Coleophoma cylindrospora]